MWSNFLAALLTKVGLSHRPGFYSVRGATNSDLNSKMLEGLFQGILERHGKDAGDAFVQMVQDIQVLSATDFLLSLASLEGNEWRWTKTMTSGRNGNYAGSEGEAWGTVLEAMSGGPRNDDTAHIRGDFLWARGIRLPPKYAYDYNDGCPIRRRTS